MLRSALPFSWLDFYRKPFTFGWHISGRILESLHSHRHFMQNIFLRSIHCRDWQRASLPWSPRCKRSNCGCRPEEITAIKIVTCKFIHWYEFLIPLRCRCNSSPICGRTLGTRGRESSLPRVRYPGTQPQPRSLEANGIENCLISRDKYNTLF